MFVGLFYFSFQRVQNMVEELPDNQQVEFKKVKNTLDSLIVLDERYTKIN